MKNPLKRWFDTASVAERRSLAALAKTTVPYLYQVANGHRSASADLAIRIDRAAWALNRVNTRLPEIRREHLASACRSCEYAQRCKDAR